MQVQWLGSHLEYTAVYQYMEELLHKRIEGEIEDQLLLVEHAPTYTVGRAKNALHNILDAQNTPVVEITRGGDVTFHGPGQLTGYPIVKLPIEDINAYLRFLEQFWIDTLHTNNITSSRDERNTGVWVEGKKMVAIGIAMRRWVCWHGFACNISVDIDYFSRINPCGMSSNLVTKWTEHQHPPYPSMEEMALYIGEEFRKKWLDWVQSFL